MCYSILFIKEENLVYFFNLIIYSSPTDQLIKVFSFFSLCVLSVSSGPSSEACLLPRSSSPPAAALPVKGSIKSATRSLQIPLKPPPTNSLRLPKECHRSLGDLKAGQRSTTWTAFMITVRSVCPVSASLTLVFLHFFLRWHEFWWPASCTALNATWLLPQSMLGAQDRDRRNGVEPRGSPPTIYPWSKYEDLNFFISSPILNDTLIILSNTLGLVSSWYLSCLKCWCCISRSMGLGEMELGRPPKGAAKRRTFILFFFFYQVMRSTWSTGRSQPNHHSHHPAHHRGHHYSHSDSRHNRHHNRRVPEGIHLRSCGDLSFSSTASLQRLVSPCPPHGSSGALYSESVLWRRRGSRGEEIQNGTVKWWRVLEQITITWNFLKPRLKPPQRAACLTLISENTDQRGALFSLMVIKIKQPKSGSGQGFWHIHCWLRLSWS